MPIAMPTFSRQSFRDHYKRRCVIPNTDSSDESISIVNERIREVKLRHRRAETTLSFYDNNIDDKNKHIVSKWTIVRQRLPDILALSDTYKPSSLRAQLVLLVAMMNKHSHELRNQPDPLHIDSYNDTISHIVPSNVMINISGRSQLISLKHIPSEQMIHVDVDGLLFSIPTRQFILSLSRGYTHETAAKYYPPAIREMLIDLSKTKVLSDRQQYQRAQLKLRLGKILFFIIFTIIIIMMLALMLGAVNTILKLDSLNKTLSHISIHRLRLTKTNEIFPLVTRKRNQYW